MTTLFDETMDTRAQAARRRDAKGAAQQMPLLARDDKRRNLTIQFHEVVLYKQQDSSRRKIDPGFIDSMKGKEGNLRSQAIAKRLVGMFGRSVIIPGGSLSCLEAQVPQRLRTTVTQRFICRANNTDVAKEMLASGKLVLVEHDGAFKRISSTPRGGSQACACGSCITCVGAAIDALRMDPHGAIGFRRAMAPGDMVIVNRQPSLSHKAMQALRVSRSSMTSDSQSLSLPVQIASEFNADFDGDEMNMHAPQDPLARAEALTIASTPHQFVVPTTGHPIRGLIQDHISVGVLLTRRDALLTREE